MEVDLAQFRSIFFEEAADHLEVIQDSVDELTAARESASGNANDRAIVDRIFRSVHSVKGAANSFGLSEVVNFAHHVEDFFDRLQGSDARNSADFARLLADSTHVLQEVIAAVQHETPQPDRVADLIAELTSFGEATNDAGAAPAGAAAVDDSFAPDVGLLQDFLAEADEHIEMAEQVLLALDGGSRSTDDIDALYRVFHTIKGVAAFIGLADIQALTHEAESSLDKFRRGERRLATQHLNVIFRSVEALSRQLGFASRWIDTRGSLQRDENLPAIVTEIQSSIAACDSDDPTEPLEGDIASAGEAVDNDVIPTRRSQQDLVKVDRERLDQLINVIGELLIAESMVQIEFADSQLNSRSLPPLNKIARELQDLSLSLRMVPLRATFQKMALVARDISRKLGKQVKVRLEGEDTELDKSMVDRIGDPLIHMVRNAIDHGLETPDERRAAGKGPTGQLVLRAYHKEGNVCIELEDDGRGLNRDAIRHKAVERGLLRKDDEVSDRDVYNLVFEPGFSTAKAVTEVSGRGVGMDVVRRNIEEMQGVAQIDSTPGAGATFTMWLPLTFAILDGLHVRVGESTLILPLMSVVESIRPAKDEVRHFADCGEMLVLRGETYCLVRLHSVLGLPTTVTEPSEGLLVIIENRGKRIAVLVDELVGQQQVVMKSLEANYKKIEGISGATILGDGSVALIVDAAALQRLALGT